MTGLQPIEALVSSHLNAEWRVHSRRDVSGRRRAEILNGLGVAVFVKFTNPPHALRKAQCEAMALERMAEIPGVRTPAVIGAIEMPDGQAALVLEAVRAIYPTSASWEAAAEMVVALHRSTDTSFGLDHDNFIGDFDQDNSRSDSWPQFYAGSRLTPMLRRLETTNIAEAQEIDLLWRVIEGLDDIAIEAAPPSLLHGDLWPGNVIFDERGPLLIDPAVSFGDREMDLAFGRMALHLAPHLAFPDAFYARYESLAPLPSGHEHRAHLWQLWPLLAHAIQDGRDWMPPLVAAAQRCRDEA
ncbi:hypothetical protein CDN99_05895 [Roseateles aquatilis]|uniref:Protein kinase domain-containing protein n=1 Tax=Roseateles aquatilis TaxID=431061 RepID=A0A246JI39_9BURK|nr:fructosamine kinase family protein [Roseateles aquatilis]OWQ91899.1 hypothetical protein CDN99_05895 [Roseateles aquatilis]